MDQEWEAIHRFMQMRILGLATALSFHSNVIPPFRFPNPDSKIGPRLQGLDTTTTTENDLSSLDGAWPAGRISRTDDRSQYLDEELSPIY